MATMSARRQRPPSPRSASATAMNRPSRMNLVQMEFPVSAPDPAAHAASLPVETSPLLSVVVPAFDEIATLPRVLENLLATPIDKEVIVVDDGSRDGTREWLRRNATALEARSVRVLSHERNEGKTAAVRTGIGAARGRIVLIHDADLEYDPLDHEKLIEPIAHGLADAVYGSRFLGLRRRVLLFWHTIGNRVVTLFSNAFTDLNLSDVGTGLKAFRTDLVKEIPLRSRGFGFEYEITVKLAQRGARIYEVPISYDGREYWEGKKVTWKDGVRALGVTLRYAKFPTREDVDAGLLTLRRVDRLRRYNRYIWERVRPWVGRNVLEIGSGTGGITRFLVTRENVTATDPDPRYRQILTRLLERHPNVHVAAFELGAEGSDLPVGSFDTVVCSNVLEHVEDDVGALKQVHALLSNDGRVILIVPMLRELHGTIDAALSHHRRYEREELHQRLAQTGFRVEHSSAFNALGVPGWWLNSRVLRRRSVPGLQARINDLLVPWLRVEERLGLPFGMSLLVVARKVDG